MKIPDKVKRKNTLSEFGFGEDVMKGMTVCTSCNSLESNKKMFCSKCGTRLPRANLYDYYRASHRKCPKCKTLLSDSMRYCPKCGMAVKTSEAL